MTPQERALIDDMFDRLAKLESAPRDPEAEQAIRAGLAKAPNALYALVQSVLVQDEALKRADAHIRELEGGGDAAQDDGRPKSFLDNMREALLGRDDHRGSVPTVRPGDQSMGGPQSRAGVPWGTMQPPPAPYQQDPRGGMMGGGMFGGGGGSFLGTAAAAAAGVIGGGLLLGGIRNMLGGSHGNQSAFGGTFDQIANDPNSSSSPWSNAGNSDLARQAGLNDIGGGGGRQASNDTGGGQGLFGGGNDGGSDDTSFNDDVGGVDGGGSDTA